MKIEELTDEELKDVVGGVVDWSAVRGYFIERVRKLDDAEARVIVDRINKCDHKTAVFLIMTYMDKHPEAAWELKKHIK